uniref:Uncharacterized protein n=1 Tax=Thermus caliditerrae TaxID=1330700 RepID=A0A7C5RDZ7_9DEIN
MKKRKGDLNPLKHRLMAQAAEMALDPGRPLTAPLALALAASRGRKRELLALAAALDAGEDPADLALRLLRLYEDRPPWVPPPGGWAFMKEVLDAHRPGSGFGGEGASEVYLALVELAHFSPLYRARLARVGWDMWGHLAPEKFRKLATRLAREGKEAESEPPLRGKA